MEAQNSRRSLFESSPIPTIEGISELESETIMAIDMQSNSTIGCAFYCGETKKLSVSEDMLLAGTDIAEQFLNFTQPTTVLVSRRVSAELLNLLEEWARSSNSEGKDSAVFDSRWFQLIRPRRATRIYPPISLSSRLLQGSSTVSASKDRQSWPCPCPSYR